MAKGRKELAKGFVGESVNFIKLLAENIKDNFKENGQDLVDNGGAIGSVIKVFGQHHLDKFFERMSTQKLENFGVICYLKGAMDCAEKALKELPADIFEGQFDLALFVEALEEQNTKTDDLRLYLNPDFNPAVTLVRETYLKYLQQLSVDKGNINKFSRAFESNIKVAIEKSFGDDYDKHQDEVKQKWFNQSEELLLAKMSELKRVGLQDGESLAYEETYGQWRDCEVLNNGTLSEAKEIEQHKVTDLLEEHFNSKSQEKWKDVITFIAADFGKGKTVFMKHYAAMMADKYLDSGSGALPVYFNLNQFKNDKYDRNRRRDIIASCLHEDFNIDIEGEYFKDKSFVFLIDSLDESGDLSLVHDVVNAVRQINKNIPQGSPCHKIVIATRPIDRALTKAIKDHESRCSAEEHPQFISLYGFKPAQFDNWLKTAVVENMVNRNFEKPDTGTIDSQLLNGWQQADFSAYDLLKERNVLGDEELVKPLFAYILYQLLTNHISIPASGRVGIYLAFLHYITSQAKFVTDTKVTMADEHRNRKVLHAIAALWCKQTSTSGITNLSKGNINYSLLGTNILTEQSKTQIEQMDELKFLSHSYFGDNEQQLHFQHQSFAEILLAEYYLKVFLSEALSYEPNIMRTRQYLFVGEPTVAAMTFFEELIKLLVLSVGTVDKKQDDTVIAARKLLLPTLGSLATPCFMEKLHSESLRRDFYGRSKDTIVQEERLLNELWPVDEEVLDTLMKLASDILAQKNSLRLTPAKPTSALYDNELILLEEKNDCGRPDVDKWLAIALGGLITREILPRQFFFNDKSRTRLLFQLIQDSPQRAAPGWLVAVSAKVFHQLQLIDVKLHGITLNGLDFSSSVFTNVEFRYSEINSNFTDCSFSKFRVWFCRFRCDFSRSKFNNSLFSLSHFFDTHFDNLKKLKYVDYYACTFDTMELPAFLQHRISHQNPSNASTKMVIGSLMVVNEVVVKNNNIPDIDDSLSSLLGACLKLKIITPLDITNSFEFMSKQVRDEFVEDWPEELKPLFSTIRDDPEYLALERRYLEQKELVDE